MADTQQKPNITPTLNDNDEHHNCYDIHVSILNEGSQSSFTFNLEKAVCSHGLFLMAPNQWDPLSKSLLRPLRHSLSTATTAAPASSVVRISSGDRLGTLLVRVYGVRGLPREEEGAIVAQVKRMLRLSENDDRKVEEFWNLHSQAKELGFGRVFRSPTLFEDMVKAMLFCNCQFALFVAYLFWRFDLSVEGIERWPRTLSMAKALCDLQLELQSDSSVNVPGDEKSKVAVNGAESFIPGTPIVKESQRKRKMQKVVSEETADAVIESNIDVTTSINSTRLANGIQLQAELVTNYVSSTRGGDDELNESSGVVTEARMKCYAQKMGNFPSPIEIASLDENYLEKRCGLGYRAGRILKLAQSVVDGRIRLDHLEELCNEASLSNYIKLDEKLKEIEGYGPFTRGNVMMCLGFYNVVPTDSETIRHLKQVHGKTTTTKQVQKVVDEMYKNYEPYQFLAYWWEIWSFYEGHFGKFSDMPSSEYKLITASNMRTKKTKKKAA